MTAPATRIVAPGRWNLPSLSEVFEYRELLFILVWRDIKVRYKQTVLGALWAVLQPVLTMVVFTVIFGRVAHIPSDDVPYALFALAGLVPWTFFANGLLLGGNSLVTDAALVTKVYFPRILIPVAAIFAGLVDFAIASVVLLAMVFAYGRVPSAGVVAVPVIVVAMIVCALGMALLLAALNVRYRDVRYVVPFLTQLWLFATPVAYSTTLLHEPWRTISALNPMTGVVQGFRAALLGVDVDAVRLLAVSTVAAVVMAIVGVVYFARVERTFADLV